MINCTHAKGDTSCTQVVVMKLHKGECRGSSCGYFKKKEEVKKKLRKKPAKKAAKRLPPPKKEKKIGIIKRIIKWQFSRGLIPKDPKEVDTKVEALNILEEVVEMIAGSDSKESRLIAIDTMSFILEGTDFLKIEKQTQFGRIDALNDIIVFAMGAIRKEGFDPAITLEETVMEIESRKGKIIKGKFEKDLSAEAMKKWYDANYEKARLYQ